MNVAYGFAWLLSIAAGAACVLALSPPRVPGRVGLALG